MEEYVFAFQINNHIAYRLACAVWTHIEELGFEAVKTHYLVFDDTTNGFTLYGPGALADGFARLERGPNITLTKCFIKK